MPGRVKVPFRVLLRSNVETLKKKEIIKPFVTLSLLEIIIRFAINLDNGIISYLLRVSSFELFR